MAVPPRTTQVNDGGVMDNHDATTIRYGECTVRPAAPRAPTIVCCLILIVIMNFGIRFNLFGGRESIL